MFQETLDIFQKVTTQIRYYRYRLSTKTNKMGIMGNNTRFLGDTWLCGFNQLKCHFVEPEIAARFSLTKDLTVSKIPWFPNDEIIEMKHHSLSLTFSFCCILMSWNDVSACLLSLYLLRTVNVILHSIFHNLYLKIHIDIYIYIYTYIYIFLDARMDR